ncbi:MAG: hypothetical protein KGQ49_00265 [Verrucomicrobia bacterium]|nr:hypothetical protein [Verrucomicrobiota bacterium]MBU6445813.1 hypothetical protein [Verrucomicrobiota bacterium]MDE3048032.1 hypothetical protein [Verrucomicrobiota bacterium]
MKEYPSVELLDEIIAQQRNTLLKVAQRIVPRVTEDDLLQPNDFPELELHPHFRYEEGILDGLMVAKTALLACENSNNLL